LLFFTKYLYIKRTRALNGAATFYEMTHPYGP